MAYQRVDGAVLEAANAKAKAEFLAAYQGATISIPTEFHHRQVVRAYKRTFAIIMRNWWLATNIARSQHPDKTLAAKIEQAMLKRLEDVRKHYQQAIKQCQALVANAGADAAVITHVFVYKDDVRFLGPVAMRFREVLLLADKYLDLVNLLYTFGEIDEKAHGDASYDVRNRLASIDTSVRNHWIGTRNRLNEEGKGRPTYNGPRDAATGADGAKPGAAEASPASASSPVVEATTVAPVATAEEAQAPLEVAA